MMEETRTFTLPQFSSNEHTPSYTMREIFCIIICITR